MSILPYALGICLLAVTISMLLCLVRLVMGPSIVDRLLALDTLFLNATCLVVILGIYWQAPQCLKAHYWLQCWALFQLLHWLVILQRVMWLIKEKVHGK